MKVSLVNYQNLSLGKVERKITKLIERVKKYNGSFVLLWHNSSFNFSVWNKYASLYKNILMNYND